MKTILTLASLLLATGAMSCQAADRQTISTASSHSTTAGSSTFFTGQVSVTALFTAREGMPLTGGYVTFEPGARSAWHTHPTGQYLVVTAGTGWTQQWGGPIVELHVGDVLWCPPGVKHWHGATPTTSMTHMALTGTLNDKNVDWMELVSDAQYHQ